LRQIAATRCAPWSSTVSLTVHGPNWLLACSMLMVLLFAHALAHAQAVSQSLTSWPMVPSACTA